MILNLFFIFFLFQSQNYGMQSAIVNPYLTDSSGSGAGSLYNVEEQVTSSLDLEHFLLLN